VLESGAKMTMNHPASPYADAKKLGDFICDQAENPDLQERSKIL